MVHEQKLIQQDNEKQALKATSNTQNVRVDKGKWKGTNFNEKVGDENLRRNNRGYRSNDRKLKSADRDKANVECFRCHRYGNYRSECYTNLNKMHGEKSNFAEAIENEEEISLLMVCHAKEETNKDLWYLDTGCSNHMSGDKSAFSTLDESYRDTVKFGDCSKVSIMGKRACRYSS